MKIPFSKKELSDFDKDNQTVEMNLNSNQSFTPT